MRLAAIVVVLGIASVAAGAQNLYPDPGFEATGEPGTAHSGARAGHLVVGARNHWAALGGPLTVQPFARYRVTEWVRARPGSTGFAAPYCYAWDSYEWAFVAQAPAPSAGEWTKVEITFVAPARTMYVHPLAYTDAENGEAWVDDVVVERVAEPRAVMAEMLSKPRPTVDEKRLIARWQVAHGDLRAAAATMRSAEGLTRADIATVLAAAVGSARARRPYLVEVAASGGPTYFEGVKRFGELCRGMTAIEELDTCAEGAERSPGLDRAGMGLRLVADSVLSEAISAGTVGEGSRAVAQVAARLRRALSRMPADSPAAKEIRLAMDSVQAAQQKVADQRAQLGACVVRIGGKVVAPSTHSIVVPDSATPQEQYAARELRRHLELITGGALPIVAEREAGRATPLFVGRCKHAGRPALAIDARGLGTEGLHVRTDGPAILLAGGRRGALYAVYSFLEDDLGCRWFTPDCSTWPRTGTIDVGKVDRRYVPPLEYRAGDYPVARPGEFAARLRLNGSNHGQTDEQGGKVGVHSLAHTFAALVPPDRYFKDHPDYFSLVNGQRQSGYAQLCLTNPAVVKLAIAGVRRWIAENPTMTVFSVSQNDTANYCECPTCSAAAKEEGSQAGPMLRFVNAVAADIARDHPNIAIETLAYQYTRKPPRITRPRPNVIVCLCSIECCFVHPLASDPYNKTFVDDIVGWSHICSRLWIWDYIINYAHSISPFPNLNVLQPNVRFFLDHGVKGIYEESCYYTKGSELQELRNYLMARALWNPAYDTRKGTDEFCAAYYGAAGPYVRRYVELIHEATQRDPGLHVQIYTHPRQYVTPAVLAEAQALFDQAEAAVGADPTLLHRVQVARLPVQYAEITLATGGSLAERGDRLVQQGGTDVSGLAATFERVARAEGVTQVREGGPEASLDAWLAAIPRRPHEVHIERLKGAGLEADILPELGGRIWRLRALPAARDVLLVAGSETARAPLEGGYEEYGSAEYRALGWSEPYRIVERSERAITVQAALRNGLTLTRRVEVDAVRPIVTVTSTLTNPDGPARPACLRVHPEFSLVSMAGAKARIRAADGTWREVPLANPADPAAEKSLWLRDADLPAGEWELVDQAGATVVTNRFRGGTVAQCLLNWSGAAKRANLELYTAEQQLAPGQAITLTHEYEIRAAP